METACEGGERGGKAGPVGGVEVKSGGVEGGRGVGGLMVFAFFVLQLSHFTSGAQEEEQERGKERKRVGCVRVHPSSLPT